MILPTLTLALAIPKPCLLDSKLVSRVSPKYAMDIDYSLFYNYLVSFVLESNFTRKDHRALFPFFLTFLSYDTSSMDLEVIPSNDSIRVLLQDDAHIFCRESQVRCSSV